jgi:hypothetical protein
MVRQAASAQKTPMNVLQLSLRRNRETLFLSCCHIMMGIQSRIPGTRSSPLLYLLSCW